MHKKVIENTLDPDFLIVGAAKSGTTSLYYYLKQHPHIFMPAIKEPFFYVIVEGKDENILLPHDTVDSLDEYRKLFKDASPLQVKGEASVGYLYLHERTIKNIKKYHSRWNKLKIIIILRNPVDRALSHYLHYCMFYNEKLTFEEIINAYISKNISKYYEYIIDYGFYYPQVKAYKENFEHVKVYLFDDLKRDAKKLIKDIFEFLEVDSALEIDTNIKTNPSGMPRNRFLTDLMMKENPAKSIIRLILPEKLRAKISTGIKKHLLFKKTTMNEKTRKLLEELYRHDILKLQDLIQKDLSAWLR